MVKDSLERLKSRIHAACARSSRKPEEIDHLQFFIAPLPDQPLPSPIYQSAKITLTPTPLNDQIPQSKSTSQPLIYWLLIGTTLIVIIIILLRKRLKNQQLTSN